MTNIFYKAEYGKLGKNGKLKAIKRGSADLNDSNNLVGDAIKGKFNIK